METTFSLTDLDDPEVQHANSILRKCVHCGFCTATCPTYVLLGDELDSPRGRIFLIKEMLQKEGAPGPKVVKHIDRCLSCLSCVTTCPSGVNYMHLIDRARKHIEHTFRRPFSHRMLRWCLTTVLPNHKLFSLIVRIANIARPISLVLPGNLSRLWKLIPKTETKSDGRPPVATPGYKPNSEKTVALLPGCVQRVLAPNIDAATSRVLARHNCQTKIIGGSGCCGALSYHMGKTNQAMQYAQANIEAWHRELETGNIESIVTNTSGCGTMIKDYGHIFRHDPDWAEKSALVSKHCLDVSQLLSNFQISATAENPMTVTYHSACSLQHGQKLHDQPKTLLEKCGYNVVDVPEGHLCCGSAGTYNILQPKISDQLLQRKLANLAKTKGEIVAAGNIGCITQLRHGSAKPVVHTVELLDWATGGPKPEAVPD